MENLKDQLGNITVVPVGLRKEREKRKDLEKIPKPDRSISLKGWCDEKLAAIREEKKGLARSIISAASQEISSMWSEEGFKEAVWKRLEKFSPEWKEELLSLVCPLMEDAIYSLALDSWNKRTVDVDRAIVKLESRLPPRFSMDLVNVHKDYPASRIGYDDRGRAWDKWLTKYLLGEDSKKKVYFEPYEEWLVQNEKFYNEIYLVEFQKEKEAASLVVEAKPEPAPAAPVDEIKWTAMEEFRQMGEPVRGEPSLSWSKRQVYKGGTR